ncbi:MAG TPA: transcription termination factor Rho [Acidimicrobiales bacterium]|nr:transcription termination factor Rho [Acidimicrobiales bacterium]
MAIKPSPDRTDLESKTREDLQTIAKVKGVEVSARASKSALIEAIMGDVAPTSSPSSSSSGTRVVRSRRTVATPTDDFEDLLGEFTDAPAPASPTPSPRRGLDSAGVLSHASRAQGEGESSVATSPAPAEHTPTPADNPRSSRPERQPRDFGEGGRNNRRNRRNRSGRERFGGEAQPNADQPYSGELLEVEGLLDLREDGYGFLRTKGYHPSPMDVYVSINQVRRYHLRKGDMIAGGYRPAASNEKYPALLRVDSVQGADPELARLRPRFEDLTPLFPDEKLKLETNEGKGDLTPRIVDLIAPIGKGQRGLIVSPPKAGKTTVMKQIAQSIEANNPEVHLMVLLVDERPEEVTDIRRSVRGEVVASTFDRPAEEHTHLAELVIERAKRLVEQGRDVVIILDGITRLARAYNLAAPATGRIMSGGVDSGALYPPKKFFGAARNIEEGGSLTILASALVETGSKMDEVIFEEFKGTGNMELKLDRRLAERRLYPAIDVNGSSTRHEELLFNRELLPQVWKLRRVLNGLASEGREAAGLELLIDKLKTTRSNDEFLAEIAKGPNPTS